MSTTITATSPPRHLVLNGSNVTHVIPEVDTHLASSHRVNGASTNGDTVAGTELEGYDEEQIRLMDEVCIVVDEDDKPIGSASKKVCMRSFDCFLLYTLSQRCAEQWLDPEEWKRMGWSGISRDQMRPTQTDNHLTRPPNDQH